MIKSSQFVISKDLEDQADDLQNITTPDDNMVVFYDDKPSEDVVLEIHDTDQDDDSFEFSLGNIPGAEQDEFVEIEEPQAAKEKEIELDPWGWDDIGLDKFFDWLQDRFNKIPKHNGKSISGVERAIKYLEKLEDCISDAMQDDLDGIIDVDKIEEIRDQIDDGIARLEDRLDKLNGSKKSKKTKKTKKTAEVSGNAIVKEANKSTKIDGIVITVPLLISRIARTCINALVSAGKDIDDVIEEQVNKYKLSMREQAELYQLLFDMGYPARRNAEFENEDFDIESEDNEEYAPMYKA